MPTRTTLMTGAAALVTAGSLAFAGATLAQANTPDGSGSSTDAATATDGAQDCGPGGRGGHEHTEVTGEEATKVTAAVTAQDSAITVEQVRKDPDGSYDVLGTKAGSPVMVEVSADLATVEVRTGGPGRGGRRGGPRGESGRGGTPAPSTAPSTGTSPTDVPSTPAT